MRPGRRSSHTTSYRARLYLAYPVGQRDRYAGRERAAAILRAFVMRCWPASDVLLDADVIGPARSYRSADTWSERPFADGVVFVGDAAGCNDPIVGQGLSIAMRDVRLVSRSAPCSNDWSPDIFEPYAGRTGRNGCGDCVCAHSCTP